MDSQKKLRLFIKYLEKLLKDIKNIEYVCDFVEKNERLKVCKLTYTWISVLSLIDTKELNKDTKLIESLIDGYKCAAGLLASLSLEEIENTFPISKDKIDYIETKKYFSRFDRNKIIKEYLSPLEIFTNYKNKTLFDFFLNRTKFDFLLSRMKTYQAN